MLTTALDLLGVLALAAFVWFCWPPLVLLVVGAAALVVSWRMSPGDKS
jgi:hypothetical protein